MLEERMRALVKKDIPIQVFEMIPSNATAFLKHHGNREIAAGDGLVEIFQIDRFAGLSPGTPLESTGQLKFFKLLDFQKMDGSIRIIGSAAPLKSPQSYPISELRLLEKCPGGWLWLPRGEVVKKILFEKIRPAGLDYISTPGVSEKELMACHGAYGKGSFEWIKKPLLGKGEELVDPSFGWTDRAYLPLTEENVISFLQNITKFLKIFTFDLEIVFMGKPVKMVRNALEKSELGFHTKWHTERGDSSAVVFLVEDNLGRKWEMSRLGWDKTTVVLSLFHSLERFVTLLVEKTKGKLPFWLQPEQIRIISMQPDYAREIKEALEEAGFRVGLDEEDELLAKRLQRALRERIPCCIVLGDREKKSKTITVREGNTTLNMNIEKLIDRLKPFENQ